MRVHAFLRLSVCGRCGLWRWTICSHGATKTYSCDWFALARGCVASEANVSGIRMFVDLLGAKFWMCATSAENEKRLNRNRAEAKWATNAWSVLTVHSLFERIGCVIRNICNNWGTISHVYVSEALDANVYSVICFCCFATQPSGNLLALKPQLVEGKPPRDQMYDLQLEWCLWTT